MDMRGIGRAALLMAAAVAGAVVAAEPSFGTFTDKRDGKTYKTTVIGGKRWMAQNLNYQTDSSWCYGNADSNCVKYGRLYNLDAARKVCPAGYHLPSNDEWENMVETAGGRDYAGKKLKAKSGWHWNDEDNVSGNGTNNYGFSVLPGGIRSNNGTFYDVGEYGCWWTEAWSDSYFSLFWDISFQGDYTHPHGGEWEQGFAVRCVADAP